MPISASDFTSFVVAARSNDPDVVSAFGERFRSARLHLPLTTLDGVRNRPETALELGARLPIHFLRLDTGEKALPLFTSLALCRECAERLGWETDARTIKSLRLTGDVALTYLSEALLSPRAERAVLNPLSDAELHVARTEIETLAADRPLRALWFYARDGKLRRPVTIGGASFLGTLLSRADQMLGSITDSRQAPPPIPIPSPHRMEALEHIESRGPFGALASELYRIVSGEQVEGLEVRVSKSHGSVRVEATPRPSEALLRRLERAAERALADEPGDAELTFRCDESSVVLTTSSSATNARPAAPASPSSPSLQPLFSYIPLEPEESD